MKFIKWLFTGEVLFSGFLLSSVFKSIFENTLVDLTFLFFVLSLMSAIVRLLKEPNILKISILPVAIYFTLATLMIVSLLYTPGNVYATEKTVRFLTLTAWSFLGVFFLIKDKSSLVKFIRGLLFYGVLTVIYVVYDYSISPEQYDRLGVNGDNVLGLGRLAGITVLIITVLYFYEKNKISKRIVAAIGFCLAVFVLLMTGSRMPLISCLISLSMLFPISIKAKRKRGFMISKKIFPFLFFMFAAIIAMIPMYLNGMFNSMFYRLSLLFGSDSYYAGRDDNYGTSLDMWSDSPILGKGVGSFPIYHFGMDIRGHSHNIFMETLSELGILGMICVVSLIGISVAIILKTFVTNGLNYAQITVAMLFLFNFLNANTTGDFNDNRMLFSFIALSFMIPVYSGEINAEATNEEKQTKLRKRYRLTW